MNKPIETLIILATPTVLASFALAILVILVAGGIRWISK